MLHCEHDHLLKWNERRLKDLGRKDPMVIAEWRSPLAELLAVRNVAYLAEVTGCKVVIAHVSQPEVLREIAAARARGARIFAETCVQYLHLTTEDLKRQAGFLKFTPPPRDPEIVEGMWDMVRQGNVHLVSSDHCPFPHEEKAGDDIWEVPFGIPGVETTLRLMLTAVPERVRDNFRPASPRMGDSGSGRRDGRDMSEHSVIRDNMRIDWDVPIPMDDGVVLRADVFRPIEDGKYPVIMTYGPYAKGLPFQVGYKDQWEAMIREHPEIARGSTCKYANWEVVDPEKWVPDGYVCVRVDSRGTGRSPGVIDIFSPRETKDFFNCVEWAAAQPWSNGKVGLNGISYYAINQWLVAGLRPPHLAAMCAWEGAADNYRDWHRHGGILSSFDTIWYKNQVLRVQYGVGARGYRDPNSGLLVSGDVTLPEHVLAQNHVDPHLAALQRELDCPWYRERSADWSKVTIPFLSCGSWGGQGLHLRGNTEAFMRAASKQKWLEIHGLEHWTHFYTDYGLNLQKRFFDFFLKGIDNGWDKEPPVLLNIRYPGERFVLRKECEWPLARTQWTKFYLHPAERTLSTKPVETESKAKYQAKKNGVTFWTEPFEREIEITGPVAAKLFISSSTIDADLFLVIQLFDPDGNEVTFKGSVEPRAPIAQGWLRASHRKLDPELSTEWRPYHTHDEYQPLAPGEAYEVDAEIWPTCIVVPPGYRLAFTIQGHDLEREEASGALETLGQFRGSGPFVHKNPWDRRSEIFEGTVTVYGGGARRSYLLLPIIPN